MIDKAFTLNGTTFQMFVYGTPDNYYGQAEVAVAGVSPLAPCEYDNVFSRITRPCKTAAQAFDMLEANIVEKVNAHHYDVGGEKLVGSVRKCHKPPQSYTEYLENRSVHYIGRLAFEDSKGRLGLTIEYVEGHSEQEAYDLLDSAAKHFAEKDGFDCERII